MFLQDPATTGSQAYATREVSYAQHAFHRALGRAVDHVFNPTATYEAVQQHTQKSTAKPKLKVDSSIADRVLPNIWAYGNSSTAVCNEYQGTHATPTSASKSTAWLFQLPFGSHNHQQNGIW